MPSIADPHFVGPVQKNKMRYGKDISDYKQYERNQEKAKQDHQKKRFEDALGIERGPHKYKKKVRTKTGKIRYVYEEESRDARIAREQRNMDRRADPVNRLKAHAKLAGEDLVTNSKQAIATARNNVEDQITKTKRYLGKLFN